MANCLNRPINIVELVNVLKGYITREEFYKKYSVQEVTHQKLYSLKEAGKLVPSVTYLITDYWPIYKDPTTGAIKGTTEVPVQYYIAVRAITTTELDPNVILIPTNETANQKSINWEVRYDITPKWVSEEYQSKGTITYLKDEYNNSAYFDFKNIVFDVANSEASKLGLEAKSYPAIGENCTNITIKNCKSLKRVILKNPDCINVTIEENCNDIILLGSATSVTIGENCKNIVSKVPLENVEIYQGISNLTIGPSSYNGLLANNPPKIIYPSDDRFVINYFDTETLTNQNLIL